METEKPSEGKPPPEKAQMPEGYIPELRPYRELVELMEAFIAEMEAAETRTERGGE
jgi:hypothetical protein